MSEEIQDDLPMREPTIEEKIQEIVEAEKRNGAEGVWNENQYSAGFHNGIVMCLHCLGVHDVQYKDLVGEGRGLVTAKAPESGQDILVVPDPR